MRSLLEYLLIVALALVLGLLVLRSTIVKPVVELGERTADRIANVGN